MIKKILSFIIGVSIILSVVPAATAKTTEDYSLLQVFGISVDMKKPDEKITRIDLAKYAVQLTKANITDKGNAVFIDIPKKHKYFPLVNTVYQNGLMKGYADGTFRPDREALTTDTYPMLLSVLGYSVLLEQTDNDSVVASAIRNSGISKGVTDGVLTNAKFARMLLNTLEADVFEINKIAGGDVVFGPGDDTYLNKVTGYKTKTGIVQAVGKASIFGADTTEYNNCVVDGVTYECRGINMLDYLGCRVRITVDNDENRIMNIRLDKRTDEIVIDAKDIESFINNTYTYKQSETKTKSISVRDDARIILNGKNMVYDENLMMPYEGSVRFTDTDSDGSYDLVVITSGIYIKVSSFIKDESLSDEITNTTIKLNDTIIECYNNGILTDDSMIEKDAIMLLTADSLIYDIKDDKVFIKPDPANCGYIKLETEDIKKDEDLITGLGGDMIKTAKGDFDYSRYLESLIDFGYIENPTLKSKALLYVNKNNEVIYYEITSRFTGDTSIKYGYVMNMSENDDKPFPFDNCVITIINDRAQKEKLYTAEKFRYNDEKRTFEGIKNDSENTNQRLFKDGKIKRQLIAYELNSEGLVKQIYTAKDYANKFIVNADGTDTKTVNPDYQKQGYKGYDNENFSLDFTTGTKSALYRNGIMHLYSFDDETILFIIPKDKNNVKKYKVFTSNAKSGITKNSSYNFNVYNVEKDFSIGALVVDYSLVQSSPVRDAALETYGGKSQACLILKKEKVFDSEEEEIKDLISGKEFLYSTKGDTKVMKEVNLYCDDPDFEDTDTRINGAGKNKPFGFLKWKELEEGDIILHEFDDSGNISKFSVLFRYSELFNEDASVNYRDINENSEKESTIKLLVSKVIRVNSDGSIILSTDGKDDYTKYVRSSTINICVYNNKRGTAEVVDSSEVRSGDTVFTRSQDGVVKEMVVFR